MSASAMPNQATEFALADESATARLGAALAHAIEALAQDIATQGLVVALAGELGAGKTSLARGAFRALGVSGPVKSPTFTLVEPYVVSSLNFYHFDFFRIADPEEISSAGLREMFGPASVCLIEWPEKAGRRLPVADLRIALRAHGDGRQARLTAASELGTRCLDLIAKEMSARAG
jgi:tRNA threonylcarbamoyladenosine biosynthesis protein TsaE